MPNIGPLELVVILVVVLLLFGAKRLPELGRSLGSGMQEFKESVTGKDDETTRAHGARGRRAAAAGRRGARRPRLRSRPSRAPSRALRTVATAIRPVGYEDRLSVVEHLDELRNRLISGGRRRSSSRSRSAWCSTTSC